MTRNPDLIRCVRCGRFFYADLEKQAGGDKQCARCRGVIDPRLTDLGENK